MPRAKSTPKKSANIEALKDELLVASLPFINDLGWSEQAILAGAEEMGLDEGRALTLFPEGETQIIAHFHTWADRTLIEQLGKKKLEKLKIRERITLAVRLRLELLADYKPAVGRAVAHGALPWHAPASLKAMYNTVDAIWVAAGDTATDFNFYSKRALLGGVYSSTLLYWLRDSSADQEATWHFLDQRIENVMQFGKLTGRFKAGAQDVAEKVKTAAGMAKGAASAAKSKVRSRRAA